MFGKKKKKVVAEIKVTVCKLQDKTIEIKVKVGSTIAECLKEAGVEIDPKESPKDRELRLDMKPAKFTDKVKGKNSFITIVPKIKGGKR